MMKSRCRGREQEESRRLPPQAASVECEGRSARRRVPERDLAHRAKRSTRRREDFETLRGRLSVDGLMTYRQCSGGLAELYRPVVVAMIPVRMV
jgi:hypothetical protein